MALLRVLFRVDAVAEDDVVSASTFYRIRSITDAMLALDALEALYAAAASVSRGVYVEIGPAQGGSTVAIALGRRAAGRRETIYTADVFKGSAALKSKSVDTNVRVLKRNLRQFDVDEDIEVVVAGRDDLATAVPADAEIGLLFIDADGALDRDLALFYDRVAPGGGIAIDDCEDKVSDKYLRFDEGRLERNVKSKGVESLAALTPLGKHYSVFRFVRTLIDLGLAEETKTVANTVFLRKVGRRTYAESGAPAAMAAARDAIAEAFRARRRAYLAAGAAAEKASPKVPAPRDPSHVASTSESVFSASEPRNTRFILATVRDYIVAELSRRDGAGRILSLGADESPEAFARMKAEVDDRKPDVIEFGHSHLSTEASADLGDWLTKRGYELLFDRQTVLALNASFDPRLVRFCQDIVFTARAI